MTAGFADRPWNAEGVAPSAEALRVPTMLSDEEGRMLHWLAARAPAGAICDLGCLVGGSTARLASGAREAGRETGQAAAIHAFDHFSLNETGKSRFLYAAGIAPYDGDDTVAAVGRLLSPWADMVRLRQGDVREARWREGPIGLLFIDAAKLPATADRIAEIFFPHLVPGHAFVVQQDYLHWRQPWLPAQMELLDGCMELVGCCETGSAIFRVTRAATHRDIKRARVAKLSDERMIALLERALTRFPGYPQAKELAQAILGLEDRPGTRAPFAFSPEGFTDARVRETIERAAARV